MQKWNVAFSVDWLTLYCQCDWLEEPIGYVFKRRAIGSRQFKYVDDVTISGTNEPFCVLESKPYSRIIGQSTVMMKLANRQLYQKGWQNEVVNFTFLTRMVIISVSRVDFCTDLLEFSNGIKPKQLISRFLSNVYLKDGRSSYTLQGEQKQTHEVSYLRFGKHDAACCVYLYNKSKEMREVKEKVHIRQMWREVGLNTGDDVWRLECSVHPSQLSFADTATSEVRKLTFAHFFRYDVLMEMYCALIKRYFLFKYNNGTKNKTRMPSVELVYYESMMTRLIDYNRFTDSSRSDLIFLNKLLTFADNYLNSSAELPTYILAAIEGVINSRMMLGKLQSKCAKLGFILDYEFVDDFFVLHSISRPCQN